VLIPGAMPSVARAALDPFPGYNFHVSLIERSGPTGVIGTIARTAASAVLTGAFVECSGLEGAMQPVEHRQGGANGATLRFPDRTTWTNIRLRRGVTLSDDLWNWCYAYSQGKGARRDGVIALANELHIPVKVWYFSDGLPARWVGPAMNAGESRLAFEELEIAHQGLRLFSPAAALAEATGLSL
jgi:phage tail-like protein